jgi:hypothetical protein
MGHFLPEALVPLLIEAIAGHCLAADAAAKTRDMGRFEETP